MEMSGAEYAVAAAETVSTKGRHMEIEMQIRPNPHQIFQAPPKPILCEYKNCIEEPIAFWPEMESWLCGKHINLIPSVKDDSQDFYL
jgi:hypothetical protein